MKIKYLFLLLILLTGVSSCEDSDSEDNSKLELSESSFEDISSDGATLTINIISTDSWVAASSSNWCSPAPNQGTSNQSLSIVVEANPSTTARNATVVVTSSGVKKTITINQQATKGNTEGTYTLPIYFHVLYNNNIQNVPQDRIETIIAGVNKLYANNKTGVQFTVANIERALSSSSSISCKEFMKSTKGSTYYNMMKDPNSYINVFFYSFTENDILGISHLPLTTQENFLEGLTLVDANPVHASQLGNIYCASINSDYINEGKNEYSPNNVTVTVAHELGHYLGLHHTFTENDRGDLIDGCSDTDYCKDTPSYNKVEYNDWLDNLPRNTTYTIQWLSQRHNCQGEQFTSDNIMDYAYSLSNRFTNNQYARIRHVLNYSPLIPGPKKIQSTRASSAETLDIHFRTAK